MVTVNQLRELSMRYIDSQSIALIYMLKALDELVLLNNECLIYPKNLYKRDENLTLYVFTSNSQLFIVSYDLEVVRLVTKNLRYLLTSDYQLSEQSHQLELSFSDGEVLLFHPKEDTLLPYVKEFNSTLVQIYKYLYEHVNLK
ncbi:MAG: DUF3908 family protein [Turicibacter sp.]|nr:DUF3908 family protein [Turicibacter sp.]